MLYVLSMKRLTCYYSNNCMYLKHTTIQNSSETQTYSGKRCSENFSKNWKKGPVTIGKVYF